MIPKSRFRDAIRTAQATHTFDPLRQLVLDERIAGTGDPDIVRALRQYFRCYNDGAAQEWADLIADLLDEIEYGRV